MAGRRGVIVGPRGCTVDRQAAKRPPRARRDHRLHMVRTRRPHLAPEAHRRNLEQVARLGAEVRSSRRRRRRTQAQVGALAGLSQSSISRLERGHGGGLTLDTWQRIGLALGRALIVGLARDPDDDVADAGHLAVQELLLRLARHGGRAGSFELATRPTDPHRSVDVASRDDAQRVLILQEAWNRIDDIGAAARSTARKVAEAEALAVAIGGEGGPYRVASVWIVRATARNRTLVHRYPEVFQARFPASSVAWWRALTAAGVVPEKPGLVWCDVHATRLFPWRRS